MLIGARRLRKLREEISNEWREDLMLFDKESNEIWRGYLERVREKEDKNAHMQFPVFAHDVSDSNCGTNYRGGNYDLLKRLSTFLAIKKFIAEKKRGNKNEQTSADWLDRMLMVHGTDFEGDAGYDVDRNFMQMLLNQSPSFVRNANDESLALVDPVAVVEQLLESRCEIAKTWCKELEDVPSDHTEIARKLLLEQLKD
ncbi:hypothetical protein GUITHDRAFT_110396 [Guillardia theta CCMP2712]|uniref:Uncharacterized protein n=1 Tax=Guillardia theta (strain CCMP2712) TaxID=905079 RepID=L1J502_GUITC|nr:hypothetical protein GUITHDRAFT_110396 [Guillardia theta CCMP2712]EKX43591.1 hypothetical protein GUITHDRAFT_110396 [Guillardia theta CCMP2712]|eukprot:XP_005830571.1 hypothetical protein GUITHDRAFT_110396 [Guillardia theta CCMP2712]